MGNLRGNLISCHFPDRELWISNLLENSLSAFFFLNHIDYWNILLLKIGFHSVASAGLELLLGSSGLPAQPPEQLGLLHVSHHAQLSRMFYFLFIHVLFALK